MERKIPFKMNGHKPILAQKREIKWPRNCRGCKNAKFFGREINGVYSIISLWFHDSTEVEYCIPRNIRCPFNFEIFVFLMHLQIYIWTQI